MTSKRPSLCNLFLHTFQGVTHFHSEINFKQEDRVAKWLQLEGTYYDQSINKQIEYKLTKPVIGGTGMLAAAGIVILCFMQLLTRISYILHISYAKIQKIIQ